jgi:hypothetical protein
VLNNFFLEVFLHDPLPFCVLFLTYFAWVYMDYACFGIAVLLCLFMLFYVCGKCEPLYFCLGFIKS